MTRSTHPASSGPDGSRHESIRVLDEVPDCFIRNLHTLDTLCLHLCNCLHEIVALGFGCRYQRTGADGRVRPVEGEVILARTSR